MFKLLNRFAWILSITLWLALAIYIDNELFIWWILLWVLFKFMFLSWNFIQERLEVFAHWLETISQSKKKPTQTVETTSLPLQEKGEIKQEEVIDLNNLVNEEKIIEPINEIKETYDELEAHEYENVTIEKEIVSEPSAFSIYIKKFFSENILAKIGAILVFLWVVFFMSIFWIIIPATWKIIIGFLIGFGTYFAWVKLDKKWFTWESRILLWTWILINFLVILAWKYIIWDHYSDGNTLVNGILSTGLTFLLLILNTIFWVVTSMVYKSRTLLLFSFIFAYLNPFLTGGSMDTPYTLVWYSLIISLWALFVWTKQNDNVLKYSAFIWWNLLFLLAPFQSEIWWITVLVSSALLGFLTILNLVKSDSSKVAQILIGNYIFIILLLISGWDNNIFTGTSSFISYMLSILFFFGIWIWLFMKQAIISIHSFLIFPILIVLWLIFSGTISFIAPSLAIIVLAYLVWFNFIQASLSPALKYIFFGILWWFIFMVNSFFSFNSIDLNLPSFITVILITFVFLFTAYYLSTKKNSEFLYTIWTLGSIFMLAPVLITKYVRFSPSSDMNVLEKIWSENYMFQISIIAIIIFALANIILPFINKQLTVKWANIKNLLIWSILGILFIGFQLFNYWEIYFPGVSLGLAFGVLAILYFILSSSMMNKLGIENVKKEVSIKNIVLSYVFISISLFSLAIALVFANNPEIISTVWLFEATILFYFFNQTKEDKIWTLWIILFIIWILQLFDLSASKWEYLFLIPLALIFISFVLNLKYLDDIKSGVMRVMHDIFHILWIWVTAVLLLDIIPSTWHGWSVFAISLFIILIWYIYAIFSSNILKIFFIITFALITFWHFEDTGRILRNIDRDELWYLRILQYISYIFIWISVYLWNKFNAKSFYNRFINSIFVLYSLAIISYFVFDIFATTFAITIFWWVLASTFLFHWIGSDQVKMRTIWLYLFSLVLWKIFIYDIWYLDNAVTRVFALMVLWILLIIISTKYTAKYWNNLIWEFNIKNLFTDKNTENTAEANTVEYTDQIKTDSQKNNIVPLVNKHIEEIDISDIDSVKFYPNKWKNFTSKAKNLKKIVRMILEEKPCGTFAPNELLDTYNYIVSNYESELSKRDFDMINWAIQDFVKQGWKVEIKK